MENKKIVGCIIAIIGLIIISSILLSINRPAEPTTAGTEPTETEIQSQIEPNNTADTITAATSPKSTRKKPTVQGGVYQDDNLLLQITNCQYDMLLNGVSITFYMENHSDKDIVFAIDKSVVIDGYTLNGSLFNKEIKAGTKGVEKLTVSSLSNSGVNIDYQKIKSLTFEYSIFESKDLAKTNMYVDSEKFTCNFK
ncbi:MAG: hypothetical protein IKR04_01610 [Clostridia bacterium]|nr:hypothetical protein [Clostridia bacterium]